MSSLVQSDVLKVKGSTRFQKLSETVGWRTEKHELPCPLCKIDTTFSIQWHHFLSRRLETSVRLIFVHCPSSRGAMWRDRELVTQEVGGTKSHDRNGRSSEGLAQLHNMITRKAPMRRRPANPVLLRLITTRAGKKAFRVRQGVSNFQPRRYRWNLSSLLHPCLEYQGYLCMRAAIRVLPQ